MPIPEYKPTHVDDADEAIITWLKSPNYRKLVQIFAEELQELEDALYAMIVERYISTAVGKNLDQWGDVVGEYRGGLLDGEYRNFIRGKIRVNASGGTITDVTTVGRYLTGADQGNTLYVPVYPAGYGLVFTLALPLSPDVAGRLRTRLLEATSAGVDLAYITVAQPGAFGFLEDDDAEGFNNGEWAVSV